MTSKKENIFYLEVLRALAAIAVIVIHVLGPYRYLYGEVSDPSWLTAVAINSMVRWCVPVFIMITGVLFLSDQRPFDLNYFMRGRLFKVFVPFLFWAVFYAFLTGLQPDLGYEWGSVLSILKELPYKNTWYHLGFYYYFIPLYFVIPFLAPFVAIPVRR